MRGRGAHLGRCAQPPLGADGHKGGGAERGAQPGVLRERRRPRLPVAQQVRALRTLHGGWLRAWGLVRFRFRVRVRARVRARVRVRARARARVRGLGLGCAPKRGSSSLSKTWLGVGFGLGLGLGLGIGVGVGLGLGLGLGVGEGLRSGLLGLEPLEDVGVA